jgi:hypothetical protein
MIFRTGRLAVAFACTLAVPALAAEIATVAEILGRRISLQELDSGQSGALTAEQLQRARGERLRGLIWTAMFEDYARQRGIEVRDAEIESHLASQARSRARLRREREERLAALAAELQAPGLSEARRRQAQQELDVLERLREFDDRQDRELRDPKNRELQRQAEWQVAQVWVRSWKINQALYREFGGRIVFQQAGWEPLDAYRRLLEQYEARRAFVIHDSALKPAVYAYFKHRFTYADEARADFYFEKPWWERSPEEFKAAGF